MFYAIAGEDTVIAAATTVNKLKAAILESYGPEAAALGDIIVTQKFTILRASVKAVFEEVKGT